MGAHASGIEKIVDYTALLIGLWMAASAHAVDRRNANCRAATALVGATETEESVAATIRLFDLLVEKQALGAQDIDAYLERGELGDPVEFIDDRRETELLPLRKAFLRRLSEIRDLPSASGRVQAHLRDLVLPRLREAATSGAMAREETRPVVAPIASGKLPPRFNPGRLEGPIASHFTWEGTQYIAYGLEKGFALYDVATGKPKIFPWNKSPHGAPSFFLRRGKDPALFVQQWGVHAYDLRSRRRRGEWLPKSASGWMDGQEVVDTPAGPYGVTVSKSGEKGAVAFFNLSRKEEAITIEIPGGTYHPLAKGEWKDERYVALVTYSGKQLVIVDAVKKKIHRRITINGYGMAAHNYRPVFFEREKGLGVAVSAIDQIVVVDARTGRKLYPSIPAPDRNFNRSTLVPFREKGTSHVAYLTDQNLVIVDLEKGTQRAIASPHEPDTEPAAFSFRGASYLAWAGGDGQVMIASVADGNITSRKVLDGRADGIVPFERDGRMMALVLRYDEPVTVIQLAGPPDESKK